MEFSGGQRQRLALARALVVRPKLLVLDEALTGLDLSTQAQIANLLLDLQASHSLTYLLISHDLALVSRMADAIAVMSSGRIVEIGPGVDTSSSKKIRIICHPERSEGSAVRRKMQMPRYGMTTRTKNDNRVGTAALGRPARQTPGYTEGHERFYPCLRLREIVACRCCELALRGKLLPSFWLPHEPGKSKR